MKTLFLEYTLQPDIDVPDPLLVTYFPTFVGALLGTQCPYYLPNKNRALLVGIKLMIVADIYVDHYWTECSFLLCEATLGFLFRATSDGFRNVDGILGVENVQFLVSEVVKKSLDAQETPFRNLFARVDM